MEADLNEGLRNIRQLVSSTAMPTAALSYGTGDRNENERQYLESALENLELIQNEDESAFEWVAVADKQKKEHKEESEPGRMRGRTKKSEGRFHRRAVKEWPWSQRTETVSASGPAPFREFTSNSRGKCLLVVGRFMFCCLRQCGSITI